MLRCRVPDLLPKQRRRLSVAKIFSVVTTTYTHTHTQRHTQTHLCIAHTYLNVVRVHIPTPPPNQTKPKLTKLYQTNLTNRNQSNMKVKSIFDDTLHALRSGLRYFPYDFAGSHLCNSVLKL